MKPEFFTQSAVSGATLLCFALPEEARPAQRKLIGRNDVEVLVTGIGRSNAGRLVRAALHRQLPRQVFTCGFAGGLNPEFQIGEIIYSTAAADLAERLRIAGGRAATFTCSDRIATTSGEKAALRALTRADAVEMESAEIEAVCREHGVPCATVRAISDVAQEDLPLDFNELANPDQSLNFRKLALAIACSPGKIPALLKLRRATNLAAHRLAEVLIRVL